MKRFLPLLIVTLLATMALAGPVAAAKPGTGSKTVPVSGTTRLIGAPVTDAVPFTGDLTITRFAKQGDGLVAIGSISGTGLPIDGQQVALPVQLPAAGSAEASLAQVTATCDILELTLGPLDLDLLGLVVHLDQVHLEIDAEQGPGNLLGNLLCAVAGLLDGNSPLTGLLNQLRTLLNQILSILG